MILRSSCSARIYPGQRQTIARQRISDAREGLLPGERIFDVPRPTSGLKNRAASLRWNLACANPGAGAALLNPAKPVRTVKARRLTNPFNRLCNPLKSRTRNGVPSWNMTP